MILNSHDVKIILNRYLADEPAYWRCHRVWSSITPAQWYDWKWQTRNFIRDPSFLVEMGFIRKSDLPLLQQTAYRYPILISSYYLSLVDPKNATDPILMQCLPQPAEIDPKEQLFMDEDPFCEVENSPVPGLIHHYPDRALLITSNMCTTFCRHCFRKRILGQPGVSTALRNLSSVLEYLMTHTEVRDVILSGGDPLTLPLSTLETLLQALTSLKHLDSIRIGTRVPVTLPMRFYDIKLLKLLSRFPRIWILTQFNHIREITPAASAAVELIRCLGIPILNQSVLLKGINNDMNAMEKLLRGLVRIGIKPYYLHHADPVSGTAPFRTSTEEGVNLMNILRERLSGLALPTYVVELPRSGFKVPVVSGYRQEGVPGKTFFRDPLNRWIEYPEPVLQEPPPEAQGVSA